MTHDRLLPNNSKPNRPIAIDTKKNQSRHNNEATRPTLQTTSQDIGCYGRIVSIDFTNFAGFPTFVELIDVISADFRCLD
jgi:hypothetical protein